MIQSIAILYQEDPRRGDGLLKPQRWCHRQWSELTSSLNENRNQVLQVATRIAKMILILLPILASYAIGIVGIMIKVCSTFSLSKTISKMGPLPIMRTIESPGVSFINNIDPPLTERNLLLNERISDNHQATIPPANQVESPGISFIDIIDPPLTERNSLLNETVSDNHQAIIPPANQECVFQISKISQNTFVYIAQFCGLRSCLKLIQVCKDFNKSAQHPDIWNIWSLYLEHPDYYQKKIGYKFTISKMRPLPIIRTIGLPSVSFIDNIDPPLTERNLLLNERISDNHQAIIPPANQECVFQVSKISQNTFVYIAQFCGPRSCLKLMQVCKDFNKSAQHPDLWGIYLEHPDYRIWGGTKSSFKYSSKIGYTPELEDKEFLASPLQQLKTYHELCKKGEAGEKNLFYDHLARLMPGGPMRFNTLLRLQIDEVADLQPHHMSASIMRGKDRLNQDIFALHLIDDTQENSLSIVLAFTYCLDRFKRFSKWSQHANTLWKENTLDPEDQDNCSYLLRIIRCEPLNQSIFSDSKFIKTIKLHN